MSQNHGRQCRMNLETNRRKIRRRVALNLIVGGILSCLIHEVQIPEAQGDQGPRNKSSDSFADIVLVNADIRTMDPAVPMATALAIQGNRIVFVDGAAADGVMANGVTANPESATNGVESPSSIETNSIESNSIDRWIGDETVVLDAKGRLVIPGFNDSHLHFLSGGEQLGNVQLRHAATPEEFTAKIADFAKSLDPEAWILGGDWDHENWESAALPHRDWIDSITADRGVMIQRLDGHMGLANSYALRLAGIDENTPDPAGGEIVREPETGRPTGILKDSAMNLVFKYVPALSYEAKRQAILKASEHAASLGITSVQDMNGEGAFTIYKELQKEGKLKTRVYAIGPLPRWERLAAKNFKQGFGDDWIRVGGAKGFSDGSLGSTTALFFEPYADDPRTVGLPADEMFPEGAMLERVRGADAAGIQVMIHAIGDAANDRVLSIYETVLQERPEGSRRFRIEHAQHIRPQDIARYASTQTIASMQPYHTADDGRWAEKRIGKERLAGTYAYRSLLDAGVVLAFGSDWNVAPLDPIVAIEAAVTRRTLDGKNPDGWIPEEKISVHEAVYAYTMGSAYAEHTETVKGSLTPGKLADLVIVSENLFEDGFDRWQDAKIDVTIVDGKVVFQR